MKKNFHFLKSFSLIEVVLACTILILFLLAGIVLYGTGIRNVAINLHRTQAIYFANQKIEEIKATRDTNLFSGVYGALSLPSKGTTPGTCDASLNLTNCTFSTVVSDGAWTVNFDRKITSTVTWTDFGMPQSVKLQAYLSTWQD